MKMYVGERQYVSLDYIRLRKETILKTSIQHAFQKIQFLDIISFCQCTSTYLLHCVN